MYYSDLSMKQAKMNDIHYTENMSYLIVIESIDKKENSEETHPKSELTQME